MRCSVCNAGRGRPPPLGAERKALTNERVRHVNRVKGLLFGQGVSGYHPLNRDRRKRLEELVTGDGRPLPSALKAQISRELDRIELLIEQIKAVEKARDDMMVAAQRHHQRRRCSSISRGSAGSLPPSYGQKVYRATSTIEDRSRLMRVLRRRLGRAERSSRPRRVEIGQSQTANDLIQLAWLWLRRQPDSALTAWFKERVTQNGGRQKNATIVALARKLLVAMWKYVTAGVIIEGAVLTAD